MTQLLKADDGSALRFFYDSDKNNHLSEKEGRPIYDKVLYVEVISPGSRESAPVLELIREFSPEAELPPRRRENIIARYKRPLDAWLSNEISQDLIGTPIQEWNSIDVSMRSTLKELGIHTVDALAVLSDEKLRVLGMGGRNLRDRAKAYLDRSLGSKQLETLSSENTSLKEENERLQASVDSLKDVQQLQAENDDMREQIGVLKDQLEKASKPASKKAQTV